MYYELYIDVLFLENFMMDSLALLSIDRIVNGRGESVRGGRACLGGAIGSFLTCLVIICPLPSAAKAVLFHTVVNSLMLLTGLKIKNGRQFAKGFVCLYVVSAMLGGIMQFFRPFLKGGSLFYALSVLSYFILKGVWRMAEGALKRDKRRYRVTICFEGKEITVSALYDTGNRLTDPITGEPVHVAEEGCLMGLIQGKEGEAGLRYIPCVSVTGEGVMRIVRLEKMCVHGKVDTWIQKPVLGISQERISGDGEYVLLLNSEFQEGHGKKIEEGKIKKRSGGEEDGLCGFAEED